MTSRLRWAWTRWRCDHSVRFWRESQAEAAQLWKAALEREGNLAAAVADVMWRAQPYGSTEDGDIYAYLVTKGAMHRLIGAAQSNGAQIPVMFRAVGSVSKETSDE